MRHIWLFVGLVLVTSFAFAAEEDPIGKVKLAISESDLVLELAGKATDKDPLLDKMCMRLGRFTAILRRVRESKIHGVLVVPPEELRLRLHHYESFCGWNPRPTDPHFESLMPRGFDAEIEKTLERVAELKVELKVDRDKLEEWTKEAAKLVAELEAAKAKEKENSPPER